MIIDFFCRYMQYMLDILFYDPLRNLVLMSEELFQFRLTRPSCVSRSLPPTFQKNFSLDFVEFDCYGALYFI